MSYMRKNPQLFLAACLGAAGLLTVFFVPPLGGALVGAGASLLGAWMTEWNKKNAAELERFSKQEEARQYLVPELNRTIERVIYIHSRALPNFIIASKQADVEMKDQRIRDLSTGDLKDDFIPFHPVLYPNSDRFKDLPGEDAVALVAFYDSLHSLNNLVVDWWQRPGQLSVNVFNFILHKADKSLELALACINKFGEDSAFASSNSLIALKPQIEATQLHATQARQAHIKRFQEKNSTGCPSG